MAVPWLRLLVIDLSLQRHEIHPRSVHVSFVVGKEAPWQDFVRVLLFTPVTTPPVSIHLHLHGILTRQTNHRTPRTFQNAMFFRRRRSGTDGQKCTFTVLHDWNELLRRVFVGISRRRPEFDHGPLHVRFVVENVAFVQVLIRVIRLSGVSSISPVFHTDSSVTEPAETQQLTRLSLAVAHLV